MSTDATPEPTGAIVRRFLQAGGVLRYDEHGGIHILNDISSNEARSMSNTIEALLDDDRTHGELLAFLQEMGFEYQPRVDTIYSAAEQDLMIRILESANCPSPRKVIDLALRWGLKDLREAVNALETFWNRWGTLTPHAPLENALGVLLEPGRTAIVPLLDLIAIVTDPDYGQRR